MLRQRPFNQTVHAALPFVPFLPIVVGVLERIGNPVLQHTGVQLGFAFTLFQNVLVHRALHHQPVHGDLFRLANAMGSIFRLFVVRRVGVQIVQNHRVRRRQIDAHATGPRGQQKRPVRTVRGIEGIDHVLAFVHRRLAVQPHETAAFPQLFHQDAHQIQQRRPLTEQQHTMPLGPQQWQLFPQPIQFRGVRQQLFVQHE